jgi:formiminotetrahydrofolate cyclodeaminase
VIVLKDLTLAQFAAELASDSPAPGGGSASAQAGANAAGLVGMVARLSIGKDGIDTPEEELAAIRDEADVLRVRLLELVDEDTAAYEGVVATFRLPKATEEEKEVRRRAIREATAHAAAVPLETMRACRRVIELAAGLVGRSNPAADSDLGVGIHLAHAGLEGSGLNVAINLGSLQGHDAAAALNAGYQTELAAGRLAAKAAAEVIDERLRPEETARSAAQG